MATASTTAIRGTIIEAEIKSSVDASRPLPLVCGLYAIESGEGVWLCAYYGMNRSNFDFLAQKGAAIDETTLGFVFHVKEFVPKAEYTPTRWEDFKKQRMLAYGGHGG
ncbi:MAG: hypothetical protein HY508_05375 [Acidobacteria bacterium]|nr:hypothetical protein [Acidobacteriota bacterium]